MTRRQRANKQRADWNQAIAEGRVLRSQGGLSFCSFATRTDALDAITRIQAAGMDANIVDPTLAADAQAVSFR